MLDSERLVVRRRGVLRRALVAVAAGVLVAGAFVTPVSAAEGDPVPPGEEDVEEVVEVPDPSGRVPGDLIGDPVSPEVVRSGDVVKQVYNARRAGATVRVEFPLVVFESANRFEFTLNDAPLGAVEAGTTTGYVADVTDGVATVVFAAPAAVAGETVRATVAGTVVFTQVIDSRVLLGYADSGRLSVVVPRGPSKGTFTVNGRYVNSWYTFSYFDSNVISVGDVTILTPSNPPYVEGQANVIRVFDDTSNAVVFEALAGKPTMSTLTSSPPAISLTRQEVAFSGGDFTRLSIGGSGIVEFVVGKERKDYSARVDNQSLKVNIVGIPPQWYDKSPTFMVYRDSSVLARVTSTYSSGATYMRPMELYGSSPKSVLLPGLRATVSGRYLQNTSEVVFGGVAVRDLDVAADGLSVSFVVPEGAAAGPVDIELVNLVGRQVLANAFVYGAGRVSGSDRYSTAVEVSKEAFASGAGTVFVANGLGFADALSAGPAAAALNGPLLLTTPDGVPRVVSDEILRLKPGRVVIVGGTGAVSASVEAAVARLVPVGAVERVSGGDRFETSRKLAEKFFDSASSAYVATGVNFPDALGAATAAGAARVPVVMVNGTASAPDAGTVATLRKLGVSSVKIAGGTAVVSPGIESGLRETVDTVARVSGGDRYGTSVALMEDAFGSASAVWVASGANFPDALAASAVAGAQRAPLYLSPSSCVPAATVADVVRTGATKATMVGGVNALADPVATFVSCG